MTAPAAQLVPLHHVDEARARFDALTKRAAKLGVPAPLVTWGAVIWRHRSEFARAAGERTYPYREVYVTGAPVTLGDWAFVAAVDYLGTDAEGRHTAVVRSPRGTHLDPAWAEGADRCDHCGTSRRRSQTFIVRHVTTGEWKRVGSSCLADFAPRGSRDPLSVADYFADLMAYADDLSSDPDADYTEGGRARGVDAYEVRRIAELSAALIRETGGFISRKRAEELNRRATADYVCDELFPPRNTPDWRPVTVTEADVTLAAAAIEYARNLSPSSDYEQNLSALARAGVCAMKHFGYVASMVPAYERHLADVAERARRAANVNPVHVGAPGEKVDLPVTLERVITCEGVYGTSFLHIMRAAEGSPFAGAVLTWFCTGARPQFPVDAPARIKGTVKSLDVRDGRPQTLLTRVRLA